MNCQLFRFAAFVAVACAGAVGCSGGYGPAGPNSPPPPPMPDLSKSIEPIPLPLSGDIPSVPPAP